MIQLLLVKNSGVLCDRTLKSIFARPLSHAFLRTTAAVLLFLTVSQVALSASAQSAPQNDVKNEAATFDELDIRDESPSCKQGPSIDAHVLELLKQKNSNDTVVAKATAAKLTADPSNGAKLTAADTLESLQTSRELSNQMNEVYLKRIADGLPTRLALAERLGLDLKPLIPLRDQMAASCARVDSFGHSYQTQGHAIGERLKIKSEKIPPAAIDAYVTRSFVALLEYVRLQNVFKMSTRTINKLKENSPERQIYIDGSREALLRLLILRERFPYLQNTGWYGKSGRSLTLFVENSVLSNWGGMATNMAFFGEPSLDEFFGFNVIPRASGSLSGEARIEAMSEMSMSLAREKMLYPQLYSQFLSGKKRIPSDFRKTLFSAVLFSVEQSLESSKMKCESSVCDTFSVQPDLTAHVASSRGVFEKIKPAACACRIGHEQTTVASAYNIAAAAAGSGLTLICAFNPELTPICYAALISTCADIGAGIAGIYDAQVNVSAFRNNAHAQAGDAVDALTSYHGETMSQRAQFNFLYNWFTGLLSFTPYRIARHGSYGLAQVPMALMRDHGIQETAAIESVKAMSTMSPPELYVDPSVALQARTGAIQTPAAQDTANPASPPQASPLQNQRGE